MTRKHHRRRAASPRRPKTYPEAEVRAALSVVASLADLQTSVQELGAVARGIASGSVHAPDMQRAPPPLYEALVTAGLTEPDGTSYRLTERGASALRSGMVMPMPSQATVAAFRACVTAGDNYDRTEEALEALREPFDILAQELFDADTTHTIFPMSTEDRAAYQAIIDESFAAAEAHRDAETAYLDALSAFQAIADRKASALYAPPLPTPTSTPHPRDDAHRTEAVYHTSVQQY